jgi:DNA repair exonuclease SbcCD ATPase subunit
VTDAIQHDLPLILDEALESIDETGKAEAMALIEEIGRRRPVVVIDHSTTFKAMFNRVIQIGG